MYKVRRLVISPFFGRGVRTLSLATLVALSLWVMSGWRQLTVEVLPAVAERRLHHLRRSRHLAEYIDEDSWPLIGPQTGLCATLQSVPVVALVSSSPHNAEERSVIRRTWGSAVPTYFFIGRTKASKLGMDEDMVSYYIEAKQHSDLVVGDYIDSYENLTLKTAHMMQWAERNCPHAQFVLKTDDDVLVNPWTLAEVVLDNRDGHLVGYKINGTTPHRDAENKWHLPRWLYRPDVIPEYLSGTGYLVSGKLLPEINEAAYNVPLINLEDVFLTYLVAKRNLGFTLKHDSRLSPYQPLVPYSCVVWKHAIAHSLTPAQILNDWLKLKALSEEFRIGKDPCESFDRVFGFLSWRLFLV